MSNPVGLEWFIGRDLGDWFVRLRWDSEADVVHWIDIELFEIASLDPDGSPMFRNSPEIGPDLSTVASVPDLSGFVKWDGCSQFYFPEAPGPQFHFDDDRSVVRVFEAIREARRVAMARVMRVEFV